MDAADIQHESNIVWLEGANARPYVRAMMLYGKGRAGLPHLPYGTVGSDFHLVGYAELSEAAQPGLTGDNCYNRRVFYLTSEDKPYYTPPVPSWCVKPQTVAPGVIGEYLPRLYREPTHVERGIY